MTTADMEYLGFVYIGLEEPHKGDVVECVITNRAANLVAGQRYTVEALNICGMLIQIAGVGPRMPSRFRLIERSKDAGTVAKEA